METKTDSDVGRLLAEYHRQRDAAHALRAELAAVQGDLKIERQERKRSAAAMKVLLSLAVAVVSAAGFWDLFKPEPAPWTQADGARVEAKLDVLVEQGREHKAEFKAHLADFEDFRRVTTSGLDKVGVRIGAVEGKVRWRSTNADATRWELER